MSVVVLTVAYEAAMQVCVSTARASSSDGSAKWSMPIER